MGRLCHPVQNGSVAHPGPRQCVPGSLSSGVKQPEREADHSPSSYTRLTNAWMHICAKKIFNNAPGLCLEGPRKTMKNFIRDSRSPGRDLNPGRREYEAGMLTNRPWHSVNVWIFPPLLYPHLWHDALAQGQLTFLWPYHSSTAGHRLQTAVAGFSPSSVHVVLVVGEVALRCVLGLRLASPRSAGHSQTSPCPWPELLYVLRSQWRVLDLWPGTWLDSWLLLRVTTVSGAIGLRFSYIDVLCPCDF
jgi:hypothetical protein